MFETGGIGQRTVVLRSGQRFSLTLRAVSCRHCGMLEEVGKRHGATRGRFFISLVRTGMRGGRSYR